MKLLLTSGGVTNASIRDALVSLLDKPIDHPPCVATIVLAVDESERQWQVRLPEGISAGSQRLQLAKVDGEEGI